MLTGSFDAAEALVRQLQSQPQAFGHAAEAVECIETHISWLLLAGDFVYKFKKPLKLDFLDFSTTALRRAACLEELRINRRTAPDLYLGLVAVQQQHGALRVLPADQAPAGAEPAVRMRRFAQDMLLSHVLEQQRLQPAHIDALARHVAQFQGGAAVAQPGQGFGDARAVCSPVHDCLQALQSQEEAGDCAQPSPLPRLAQWCAAQGAALAPVFDARLHAGRVRECHGDLHLANLVLTDAGPQLFDAIEFNPALRWIDCVADIAFLVMDLEARGRSDLAWRFLNAWLEHTGDYDGLRVLRYYCVYRALVRARVAGMRRAQAGGAAWAASALERQRYLELAARSIQPQPAALWLAHGFSGAGKSTQSQGVIEQRGVVRVRADVERKRLFGLLAHASSAVVSGGIYTREASQRTHDRLAQVARTALGAGYTVLVDATFLNAALRARFIALADALQAPCRILSFEAPLDVLRARVQARQQAGGDASEAGLEVLESQWAAARPLSAQEEARTVHVDTTRPVDWDVLLPREEVTEPPGLASGAATPLS